MKICIDITQVQYTGTGVATYTHNLVKNLLALNAKHQFHLFGTSLRDFSKLRSIADSYHATSQTILPFPNQLTSWLFNHFHHLPLETFTPDFDLLHTSDWTQPKTNHPSVTTIHDLTVYKFPSHQHPKIIATHKKRLTWVAKEASSIITDSLATKNDIVDILKIDPAKIHVIYLAASDQFHQFNQSSPSKKQKLIEAFKSKHNLSQYLLSLGTNEPRKNLHRLIKSYISLAQSDPKLPDLVIAGKYGWGDQATHSIPPQISSKIRHLGFIDQSDLPTLYAGASVFLYPSLYEGFGLPVIEAMSLGVPTMTSKRGSLGEVAGSAAILCDPESETSIKNSISLALAQAKSLSLKSQDQAKKFSWSNTAIQTLSVYEKTIANL